MAPEFEYLGTVPFRIRDIAEGERFVFADVDRGTMRVRRLVIAQFESILPTSDEEYRYGFDDASHIAGYRFRENVFAFLHSEARAENPAGEAALTLGFLEARGLRIPDAVVAHRRLTVPDAERKHELILFTIEPLPDGVGLAEFYSGDEETELGKRLAEGVRLMSARACAVSPLPGA